MNRLPQIIRAIPRHCFEKDNKKAWSFLLRDVVLLLFIASLILGVDSTLSKFILSIIMGCVLTGIFVIGHDAGHRSFSNNKQINDAVGHICCSLTLWPYHVWRLSHDHHHKWTHHAINDLAWKPLTVDEFRMLGTGKKIGYFLSRYVLFFWASMLFQYFMTEDAVKGRFFSKSDRHIIQRSILITAAIGCSYAFTTGYFWGWSGFLFLFLIPQLVYQFWLSFFTLFHHTTNETALLSPSAWEPAKAQLGHSIHVRYPFIVDWLTHDISWHVPHHVCVSVPHYHLRCAHQALKSAYPESVREHTISPGYVWSVINNCHLIDQGEQEPVRWQKIKIGEHIFNAVDTREQTGIKL